MLSLYFSYFHFIIHKKKIFYKYLMIPDWFFEKYRQVLSDVEYDKFKLFCTKPLRKSIRVNTLKITLDDFLKISKQEWWILSQIPWCKEWFWIDREDRSKPLWTSYLHQCWYFYIQEASSMIPPEILNPKSWEKILDISAAPWSKTTQMAILMQNKWMIVANEPIAWRIKSLKSNIDRMWVINTIITQKDWRVFSQYFPNYFDKILVDAPCTWEWTIRKDFHALDNWNEKAINKLSKLQKTLILEAFHSLKPWWEMVYSTCTLSPEEDEYVVKYLLEHFPWNAEIIPIPIKTSSNPYWLEWVLRVWPHTFDTEWFFVAKIRKNNITHSEYYESIKPWQRKSPFKKVWNLKDKNIENIIDLLWKENFLELWNEFWFKNKLIDDIAKYIWIHSWWILIWNIDKNRNLDFNHEWASFFYSLWYEFDWIIEINEHEMEKYLKWYDLDNKDNLFWNIILKYKWLFIWFGKVNWKIIKNKFPRYLVNS